MLGKAGIITDAEKAQIVAGLEQVKQEIADVRLSGQSR